MRPSLNGNTLRGPPIHSTAATNYLFTGTIAGTDGCGSSSIRPGVAGSVATLAQLELDLVEDRDRARVDALVAGQVE
jgi:hypothetical protein